jgi:hypothetical protein
MIFCKRGNLYSTGYRGRRRLFCAGRERSGGNLWQTSSRIIITTAAEENNEGRRFGAATSNRISVYPEQGPPVPPILSEGVGYDRCPVSPSLRSAPYATPVTSPPESQGGSHGKSPQQRATPTRPSPGASPITPITFVMLNAAAGKRANGTPERKQNGYAKYGRIYI